MRKTPTGLGSGVFRGQSPGGATKSAKKAASSSRLSHWKDRKSCPIVTKER